MIGKVVHTVGDYGFIYARGHGRFYFHTKDVLDDFDPQVGDTVRFEPVEPVPAKGPHARDVALVPGELEGKSAIIPPTSDFNQEENVT